MEEEVVVRQIKEEEVEVMMMVVVEEVVVVAELWNLAAVEEVELRWRVVVVELQRKIIIALLLVFKVSVMWIILAFQYFIFYIIVINLGVLNFIWLDSYIILIIHLLLFLIRLITLINQNFILLIKWFEFRIILYLMTINSIIWKNNN